MVYGDCVVLHKIQESEVIQVTVLVIAAFQGSAACQLCIFVYSWQVGTGRRVTVATCPNRVRLKADSEPDSLLTSPANNLSFLSIVYNDDDHDEDGDYDCQFASVNSSHC